MKLRFEWDPVKNIENIRKHNVDFTEAELAFEDPSRVVVLDGAHSNADETRYFCYGMVGGRVLTVRFTLRESAVRIFGAGFWRAGRRKYEMG